MKVANFFAIFLLGFSQFAQSENRFLIHGDRLLPYVVPTRSELEAIWSQKPQKKIIDEFKPIREVLYPMLYKKWLRDGKIEKHLKAIKSIRGSYPLGSYFVSRSRGKVMTERYRHRKTMPHLKYIAGQMAELDKLLLALRDQHRHEMVSTQRSIKGSVEPLRMIEYRAIFEGSIALKRNCRSDEELGLQRGLKGQEVEVVIVRTRAPVVDLKTKVVTVEHRYSVKVRTKVGYLNVWGPKMLGNFDEREDAKEGAISYSADVLGPMFDATLFKVPSQGEIVMQ